MVIQRLSTAGMAVQAIVLIARLSGHSAALSVAKGRQLLSSQHVMGPIGFRSRKPLKVARGFPIHCRYKGRKPSVGRSWPRVIRGDGGSGREQQGRKRGDYRKTVGDHGEAFPFRPMDSMEGTSERPSRRRFPRPEGLTQIKLRPSDTRAPGTGPVEFGCTANPEE